MERSHNFNNFYDSNHLKDLVICILWKLVMSFSDAQAMILTVILTYIWSDGFQKNALVKTKKTLLQLFIVYTVPPDGVQDIARYTLSFALGTKQKDHHPQLIEILWQTKELQKCYLQIL